MAGLHSINNNHQSNGILLSTYYVHRDAEKHFTYIPSHKPHGTAGIIMATLELKKQRLSKVECYPRSQGYGEAEVFILSQALLGTCP